MNVTGRLLEADCRGEPRVDGDPAVLIPARRRACAAALASKLEGSEYSAAGIVDVAV